MTYNLICYIHLQEVSTFSFQILFYVMIFTDNFFICIRVGELNLSYEAAIYALQWVIWNYADPLNFTCLPLEYSILVSNFIILLLALRSDALSSSHVYKLFLYNATLWISLFSFNISKCNLNNLQICSEPTYGRFS